MAASEPTAAEAPLATGETVVATGATVEDVERLVEDECRYDLIDGELIRTVPAGGEHGILANRIGRYLGNFVEERRLGQVFGAETGFILARDPDVLLGPDAAFVRADRLPPRDQWRGFLRLAPDLVVEIVSPSDRWRYVVDKVDRYLAWGVPLVWVLDPPRRAVSVFGQGGFERTLRADAQDILDGGEVLHGFRRPLADLFPTE